MEAAVALRQRPLRLAGTPREPPSTSYLEALRIECPAEIRHRGYQRRLQQIISHERFPLLLQRVLELKSQTRGIPLSVDTATLLSNTEQLRRKHGVQYITPVGENLALDLFIETSCGEFLAMLRDIHNAHTITSHAFELVQRRVTDGPTGNVVVRGQLQQGKRPVRDTVAFSNHKRRITSTLSQFIDSTQDSSGLASSDATEADDSASSAPPAPIPKTTQARSKAKFDPWQQDILLRWLIEHEDHPYPKPKDKEELAAKTQLTPVQIQNWFTNMRKRHWLPIINGKKKPRSYLDMHLYLSHTKKNQQASETTAPQRPGSASSNRFADREPIPTRSLRSRTEAAPLSQPQYPPQPHNFAQSASLSTSAGIESLFNFPQYPQPAMQQQMAFSDFHQQQQQLDGGFPQQQPQQPPQSGFGSSSFLMGNQTHPRL